MTELHRSKDMKTNNSISDERFLEIIYKRITSNLDLVINNGLIDGKMGIAIFLYKYSQIKKQNQYKEELID